MEQVYVIGARDGLTVKIGVTRSLERRLQQIQSTCPIRVEVLWHTVGGSALEKALHTHFAAQHSHGEWFTFCSDPIVAVRTAIEDGLQADVPAQHLGQGDEYRRRQLFRVFGAASFTAEEVSKGLAVSEVSAQQWIAQLRAVGMAVLSGHAFRGVPLYKVVLQKGERSWAGTPLPSCGDAW
ncbi:GIY-YIG nuclease family protein [Streptomyces sp. NPDC045251]|uniref:GIY-YIG nuclease family protein n=1 Tax=unclassified Streptomyces TaxID=2593676 RepID=UPI00340250A3